MMSSPSISGVWKGENPSNDDLQKMSLTVQQEEGSADFAGSCAIDVQSVGRDLKGEASGTNGDTLEIKCKGEFLLRDGRKQRWSTHGTGDRQSNDEIVYHDAIFQESLTLRRA